MSKLKIFNKEISRKRKYFITIVSSTIYIVLTVLLGRFSSGKTESSSLPVFIDPLVLRGVITQIQMMISVYIVLVMNKMGYTAAILLNAGSITSAIIYMVKMKSSLSIPGMLSYIAVIIIVTLIMRFKAQAADFLNLIENQKKQLQRSEKKLYKQAYFDSLTKLPNRDFYMEKLEQYIQEANRCNQHLGIIFLDLDSFKTVNDTLGHSAGDEVLLEVAKRFTEVLDENIMVARSGGDEFIVLIKNINSVFEIEKIVVEIMGVFIEPVTVKGIQFFISGSAGVAVYPYDGNNAVDLIKNADISMYEAKRKGKNQYIFCNDEMKKEIQKRMMLTNNLYKALDKNELFLHYQPQVNTKTGDVTGFEALLRWNQSEYGPVSPAEFIPLAEQTGLIKSIGLWVFKTVCEQWINCFNVNKKNIRLSINFSLEQLKDVNIVRNITKIIEDMKVNPHNIEIEITESIAFKLDSNILEKLMELKKMGFMIAIDDFGKEYSALNRISSFPVDLIKIDMDFIHGISSGNVKDRAIVKTIIQLAKNLGIKVLAEGVETEEQYEFLKREMCDEIQGYYFYKAMPASEAVKLLINNT